ncbi:MAG: hypothetical protein EBV03_07770, partial [Proteobacteria bacterium]|nr:hypothetical protein [Pseudomonadota bacterium]
TLVEAFAAQGARVGFIDIAREAGEALAAKLPGSAFMAADLTDIPALRSAMEQVSGRIQALTPPPAELIRGKKSLELDIQYQAPK